MICVHDVDVRAGTRMLATPEEVVPLLAHGLLEQVRDALEAGLAQTTIATMLPATCHRCGAACVIDATLALRDGPAVTITLEVVQ